MAEATTWICSVCGYVHRGTEPPDECPVCGVGPEDFEAGPDEPAGAGDSSSSAPTRWRCLVCDYEHEGPEPPDECPVCGADADQFEPIATEPGGQAPPTATASGHVGRIIVVGAGVAGVAAAEAARKASPEAEVVLLSKEDKLPYYRINLTRYLAGEVELEALPLHPESWYAEQRIRLERGVSVKRLLTDDLGVELDSGTVETCDRIVLATGAHPFVPPFEGAEKDGVTCVRTVDDACRVLEAARAGARCICIGGGILGLETAGALSLQGARVTLLESFGWLMPRQLNRSAAAFLERQVERLGIELLHAAMTSQITGQAVADGVALEDGRTASGDLVIVTTGIRANTHLARQAGLQVKNGVVVDDHLTTSHPRVFAGGDIAEHRGLCYGTWMAAQSQGAIAGMNAAGAPTEFAGIPRAHILKVLGTDMFSIGQVEAEDASYTAVEGEDEESFCRFLFRDGRLVGAILMGDTRLTARVTSALESGRDCSALLAAKASAQDIAAAFAG